MRSSNMMTLSVTSTGDQMCSRSWRMNFAPELERLSHVARLGFPAGRVIQDQLHQDKMQQ